MTTLQEKLNNLGFNITDFGPKTTSRFIVQMENIPSHVIKSIEFPELEGTTWSKCTYLTLKLYNPIKEKLEQRCLDLLKKEKVNIQIRLLTPDGEVDTTWSIVGTNGIVKFGEFDWSENPNPNIIRLKFLIESASVNY